MALFALTGVISLGAGMGLGALIPVSPRPVKVVSQKPNKSQLPPKLQGGDATKMKTQVTAKVKTHVNPKSDNKPEPSAPTLEFDEFDKSLMKMLEAHPTKVSTIHPSVAYNPQYYSPESVQQTSLKVARSSTTPHRQAQSVAITGGQTRGHANQSNHLNTSWF
jgi:hypothetical protein